MKETISINHRSIAMQLFNETWDLIEKKDRTGDEDSQMLEKAYASLYHWRQVGTRLNLARGYWQVSRVHAILGQGDVAFFYGITGVELCEVEGFGDFDLAFAYESVARAEKCRGNTESMDTWIERGQTAAEKISKEQDKKYFLSELVSVDKG
ncbi:hypothetical protein [Paenisporosarcina sp. OV554]|uniref:hypothetical protein n=1 Tax=Paenisporosarcina sp. OV554 TaxID=2135694 RepID=UPI000D3BCEB6|nr:hypothetical protein [Paenisporosarcina sp. OV554]PUB16804.1 hypothetical protein C8K15_102234 [Paenisporosarcina sp. OV554]